MKLYHGDCLEIMRTLPDASVDAVIADPPYGTTACGWDSVIPFAPMWAQLRRVLKPDGAIVLFAAQPFMSALIMSNPREFRYDWLWVKNRVTGHLNARKMPMRRTEHVCVFYRRLPTYNPQMRPYSSNTHGRGLVGDGGSPVYGIARTDKIVSSVVDPRKGVALPNNVLTFDMERGHHPTQKPVDLLAYLVRTYTNPGETVLDPFMGSGTTGVACAQEGRDFIGIEREQSYYDISRRRIAAAQPPLFAEVAD